MTRQTWVVIGQGGALATGLALGLFGANLVGRACIRAALGWVLLGWLCHLGLTVLLAPILTNHQTDHARQK